MSPITSSLVFVPFSVQMRSVGYVRDGKSWVPESVKMSRDAERARLASVKMRLGQIKTVLAADNTSEANWFTMLFRAESSALDRIVASSDAEWKAWQTRNIEFWVTKEDRAAGRAFWDRVNTLRALHAQKNVVSVPSPADEFIVLRREYLENPQSYGFASVEERDAAVAQLETRICASQGRWRLDAEHHVEEQARVLRVASANPCQVMRIQRAWRAAFQRRVIRMLAERFGI
jgi:hypothetical protein